MNSQKYMRLMVMLVSLILAPLGCKPAENEPTPDNRQPPEDDDDTKAAKAIKALQLTGGQIVRDEKTKGEAHHRCDFCRQDNHVVA